MALLIPLKISSQASYSSQTTTSASKPLKWAITHSGSDKNDWLDRTDELKQALGSLVSQYGGNYYAIYRVIDCESSWKEDAKNPHSTASGISQFLNSTWKTNCEGFKDNSYAQLECMVKMFSKNRQQEWECWKILYN